MPIVLFWLTPVFLLIVVILLIIQEQQREKPKLLSFDPLAVIEALHFARAIGEEKETLTQLTVLRRLLSGGNSTVELLLRLSELPARRREDGAELLEDEPVGELARRYRYSQAGRVVSLVVGLPAAISRLESVQLNATMLQEAEKAQEKGYVVIGVARRVDGQFVDGGAKRFAYIGQIVLEPALSAVRVSKLRLLAGGFAKRLALTNLPLGVAKSIGEQVFPASKETYLSAKESRLAKPSLRRNLLDKATSFADASLDDRHEALLHFKEKYEVSSIAVSEDDQAHLPSRVGEL